MAALVGVDELEFRASRNAIELSDSALDFRGIRALEEVLHGDEATTSPPSQRLNREAAEAARRPPPLSPPSA
jgi:hypothetical protein